MGKKVLLINPRIASLRTWRLNVPVGLLYIGSFLAHKGYNVSILDACNVENQSELLKRVKEELSEAMVVGLSVMTDQVSNAIELSRYIRERNPSLPIIWGVCSLTPVGSVFEQVIE